MKKLLSLLLAGALMLCYAGCEKIPDAASTSGEDKSAPDTVLAVSQEEQVAIEAFLNDPANNGFAGSLHEYAAPQEINLRLVLYDGAGIGRQYDELSEAEQQAVQSSPNYSDFMPCVVFRALDIENYLQKKIGISLVDIARGTDELEYLKELDLYFLQKTDTNLNNLSVTEATVDKNGRYCVQYTDVLDICCSITLCKTAEGYRFISNAVL